jgi:dTDP-4-dehydrorhamnose 3,5-epimerase-like enzyme
MQRTFYVRAIWDGEAEVYISDSDIAGLHIQAGTLDEFEEIMRDTAPELVATNHLTPEQMATIPLRDLIPMIEWSRPQEAAA